MTQVTRSVEPITEQVVVDATPADAFAGFTDGLHAWWPPEYTWSGAQLERVAVEPRPGGFFHEIGPNGMRLDWGRLSVWQPPSRLAFSWLVGPDRAPEPNPSRASQVDVTFEPLGEDRTRVTVTHSGWERHGEAGAAYRDQFASAGAWPRMLERYAGMLARREEEPWTGLTT